jgi:hypothetical protein
VGIFGLGDLRTLREFREVSGIDYEFREILLK